MDTRSAIDKLRLFNEKADTLLARNFTKRIAEHFGVSMSWTQGSSLVIETDHPDEEATHAFLFTLRYFVQNNEPTSLARMAKLYEDLPVDESIKARYREVRDAVNAYLAGDTFIELNGHVIGRQRVNDVFMWGGLAHANAEKTPVYDSWKADPFLLPLVAHEFVTIVSTLLTAITYIRRLNEEVIGVLAATPGA